MFSDAHGASSIFRRPRSSPCRSGLVLEHGRAGRTPPRRSDDERTSRSGASRGGFPRGGVVELVSPANLGRGVSVALAACAASQKQHPARCREAGASFSILITRFSGQRYRQAGWPSTDCSFYTLRALFCRRSRFASPCRASSRSSWSMWQVSRGERRERTSPLRVDARVGESSAAARLGHRENSDHPLLAHQARSSSSGSPSR